MCDVGGVLVRLTGQERRARWAARLALPEAEFDTLIWEAIGSRGEDRWGEIVERIATATSLGADDADRLLRDFTAHWVPNRPLLDFLRSLHGRYRLAVLSTVGAAGRLAFEHDLGLHLIFDSLLLSAEIGVEKPDPVAYRLAAEAVGAAPSDCLFIDDVAEYVDGARSVGMDAHQHVATDETIRWLRSKLVTSDPA